MEENQLEGPERQKEKWSDTESSGKGESDIDRRNGEEQAML